MKSNAGPIPEEVERVTNIIVDGLGAMDLESALMVLCNLAGQLVCELSNDKPSELKLHSDNMAKNIKTAALIKLIHDDEKRRKDKDLKS